MHAAAGSPAAPASECPNCMFGDPYQASESESDERREEDESVESVEISSEENEQQDEEEDPDATGLWEASLLSSASVVKAWDEFARRGERALFGSSHKLALETMILRHGTSHKYRRKQWLAWSAGDKSDEERASVQDIIRDLGQRPRTKTVVEVHDQILMDVPRTCPEHQLFRTEQGGKSLERVLLAFALQHPEIGYLQSMNFLAALLLIVFENEDDTYQVFENVVVRLLPGYYSDFSGLKRDTRLLEMFVERDYPDLHKHFQMPSIRFNVAAAAPSWLLPLFFTVQSPRTVIRIWDLVLFYGERAHSVVVKVALAGLRAKRPRLLLAKSLYDVYKVIKGDHALPKSLKDDTAPDDGEEMLSCFAKDVSQYGLHTAKELKRCSRKRSAQCINHDRVPISSVFVAKAQIALAVARRRNVRRSEQSTLGRHPRGLCRRPPVRLRPDTNAQCPIRR